MNFADSHCHLDFSDFAEDLQTVIDDARRAGVRHMLTIGTRLTELAPIIDLCRAHADIHASAGIHPHYAGEEADGSVAAIVRAGDHEKMVAVGETGLDFHYDFSDRTQQAAVFRNHIRAARELDRPLVIHTREAEEGTRRILEEEGAESCGGVLHCFTGSAEMALWGVERGFHISFSGILTFRKASDLRAVARRIPLERTLIETDAPYLAPVPHRGKRNQPAHVVRVAETLAELHERPLAEVARITTANFLRLFRLDDVNEP